MAPLPATPGVTVHTLDIDGIKAHDMLRIVTAAGREIIYWPDAEQPFMAFDSERAVYRWLKARFMGEHADKAITRQFLRGETSRKRTVSDSFAR